LRMKRTFKYRLYPNHPQQEQLQATLNVCRELYNAGLQERRDARSSRPGFPPQVYFTPIVAGCRIANGVLVVFVEEISDVGDGRKTVAPIDAVGEIPVMQGLVEGSYWQTPFT
jgi:hypothetical protein